MLTTDVNFFTHFVYYSSKIVQLRKDLYFHIINQPEYLTLEEEEQKIIGGSLKRYMCVSEALLTNIPSTVPDLCQDYSLM